jgi:FkbM family methyltransferase
MYNHHDRSLWGNLQCSYPEIRDLSEYVHGVVLDIGANVGSHSIGWAHKAEVIYAFEPQPWNYYILCANLALNRVANVMPCLMALGNSNGPTTIHGYDPRTEVSIMGCQVEHGDQPAAMRTLDSLGMADIGFIKIDVEGYEHEVLKGARETLLREHPIIYVEMHGQHLIDAIVPYMESFGYQGVHARTTVFFEQPEDILNHGWLFSKEGWVLRNG